MNKQISESDLLVFKPALDKLIKCAKDLGEHKDKFSYNCFQWILEDLQDKAKDLGFYYDKCIMGNTEGYWNDGAKRYPSDLKLLECEHDKVVNCAKELWKLKDNLSPSCFKWILENIRVKLEDLRVFIDEPGRSGERKWDKDEQCRLESLPPRSAVIPSAPTLSEILADEEEKGEKTKETTAKVSYEKDWMSAEQESENQSAEEKLASVLKSLEPRKIGIHLQSLTASDWKEILSLPMVGIVDSLENILTEVGQSELKSSEYEMTREMKNVILEEQRDGVDGSFTPQWVFPAMNEENTGYQIRNTVKGNAGERDGTHLARELQADPDNQICGLEDVSTLGLINVIFNEFLFEE